MAEESKKCTGPCGRDLPLDRYGLKSRKTGKLLSRCRECINARNKLWAANNKEQVAEISRNWKKKYPDRYLRRRKIDAEERTKNKATRTGNNQPHRNSLLKHRYGISVEIYEAIFEAQGGVCKICGKPPDKQMLCVDHDHRCCPNGTSCGKCVRGLLCRACNSGIGHFHDDRYLLTKAIEYLSN